MCLLYILSFMVVHFVINYCSSLDPEGVLSEHTSIAGCVWWTVCVLYILIETTEKTMIRPNQHQHRKLIVYMYMDKLYFILLYQCLCTVL